MLAEVPYSQHLTQEVLVARVVKGKTLGLGPSICLRRDAPPNDDDDVTRVAGELQESQAV